MGTASFQPVLERLAASISARTLAMLINQTAAIDAALSHAATLSVAAGVASRGADCCSNEGYENVVVRALLVVIAF